MPPKIEKANKKPPTKSSLPENTGLCFFTNEPDINHKIKLDINNIKLAIEMI